MIGRSEVVLEGEIILEELTLLVNLLPIRYQTKYSNHLLMDPVES